jgi:hypothetical protein
LNRFAHAAPPSATDAPYGRACTAAVIAATGPLSFIRCVLGRGERPAPPDLGPVLGLPGASLRTFDPSRTGGGGGG